MIDTNVFTVTCPSCETDFPVDPAKVPEGGVLARCSVCQGVFRVEEPEAPPASFAMDTLEAPAPPAEPAPPPMPEPEAPTAPAVTPEPAAEAFPPIQLPEPESRPEPFAATPAIDGPLDVSGEAPPVDLAPAEAPPVEAAPREAPADLPEVPVFGRRDPKEKARRLARVLVSDMITYNADRHARALANGTLESDFEEEIKKSWMEYVDQVGAEMADGTPYFTDALNEILAQGRPVF